MTDLHYSGMFFIFASTILKLLPFSQLSKTMDLSPQLQARWYFKDQKLKGKNVKFRYLSRANPEVKTGNYNSAEHMQKSQVLHDYTSQLA